MEIWGAIGRDASILTVTEAIDVWKPCGVVMVGIAFGKDEAKQKIGDVLVAKTVINYESSRVSQENPEVRSKNVESGQILYNRFYNKDDWTFIIDDTNSTPRFGSILSGEKLIDSKDFRDELFKQFPSAIGGEMEGFGLYSACTNKNISEWIIVKGICDWADGNKNSNKSSNQQVAAAAAVSLCESVFSEDSFAQLYNVDIQNTSKKKEYRVPTRNNLFHGRDCIFEQINQNFKNLNLVVLSGLSGVGKSQIAREYVYRNQAKYDIITWITAEDYRQLIQEYCAFIEYNSPSTDLRKVKNENIIELFKSYFTNKTSLIIIDNANNIDLIDLQNATPHHNVKVLVTTQNSNWDIARICGIPINNLKEKEAVDYLLAHTNNRLKLESDIEDSKTLVTKLSGFPIALEYARAYINKRKISFAQYLNIFNEYSVNLFNGQLVDYHQSALLAWKMSLQHATNLVPAAKDFLYSCSFLNCDLIETDFLFIKNQVYTRLEMDEILNALLSYSLVEIINDCTVRIHPLTQEYVKLEQKDDRKSDEFINKQIYLIWSAFPDTINNKGEATKTKALIPHGFSIMEALLQDENHMETALNVASNLSGKLYAFSDYISAINCINNVLKVFDKEKYMLEYVKFLNSLSLSYHYTGDLEKANKNIDIALSCIDKITDIKTICTLYNTKGIILKEKGDYKEAFAIYKSALILAKNNNEKNILINILMNIGIIHKHCREYPKAINAYRFCLENCDNETDRFKLLSNLAIVYKENNNTRLAIPVFEECLKHEENIGNLRLCAVSHDHLGYCYLVKKDYVKSYNHLDKALKIAGEINFEHGKANTYYNFGTYYLCCGDLIQAKSNYEKSLEISVKLNYQKGILLANESLSRLPK